MNVTYLPIVVLVAFAFAGCIYAFLLFTAVRDMYFWTRGRWRFAKAVWCTFGIALAAVGTGIGALALAALLLLDPSDFRDSFLGPLPFVLGLIGFFADILGVLLVVTWLVLALVATSTLRRTPRLSVDRNAGSIRFLVLVALGIGTACPIGLTTSIMAQNPSTGVIVGVLAAALMLCVVVIVSHIAQRR